MENAWDMFMGLAPQTHERYREARKRLRTVLTDVESDVILCGDIHLPVETLEAMADAENPDARRLAVALYYWQAAQGLDLEEVNATGLNAASGRRTRLEMARFRQEIFLVLVKQRPMTVRQVFYQMTTRGLEKTEASYGRVQGELVNIRRGRDRRTDKPVLPHVPYGWITDGTRWMRKPTTWNSVDSLLASVVQSYRRDLWEDQDAYVELWIEKDALAGVLMEETVQWDVPLMVSRGFSSATFLYEAAEAIKRKDKPAYVYVFTDHDRAGENIAKQIRKGFDEHAPEADITVERVAVTAEQIEIYGLPTRPPKQKGDPPAVELDALPPDILREIARECIEQHVDHGVLERTEAIEGQERESLTAFMGKWNGHDGD